LIVCGAVAGVYAAGGIEIGPKPVVYTDSLQQSYDADRVTQATVLRELSEQDFDGSTDDGRRKAGEWFNAQRFRNRANDFGGYTDRVAEAIAANSEDALAAELEGK
jgi:cytochrome c556